MGIETSNLLSLKALLHGKGSTVIHLLGSVSGPQECVGSHQREMDTSTSDEGSSPRTCPLTWTPSESYGPTDLERSAQVRRTNQREERGESTAPPVGHVPPVPRTVVGVRDPLRVQEDLLASLQFCPTPFHQSRLLARQ